MKKLISLGLVMIVALGCLASCNFTTNSSGDLAGKAKCEDECLAVLNALSDKRFDDAAELMHPEISEDVTDAFNQISSYLNGRKSANLKLVNISVNTSTGTSGKTVQEKAAFEVTLSNGEVVYLSAVYLENGEGAGFISFQLVLGLV